MVRTVLALLFLLVVSACSGESAPTGTEPPATTTSSTTLPDVPPLQGLTLVPLATGLEHPVSIAPAPGIESTFVVERPGRVSTLESAGADIVLDITDRVGWEISEQGFLGFAVHPSFPDDPRGFAVYTNLDKDVVVTSFDWTARGVFDKESEKLILEVPQPHFYHQGGGITFGPQGYLWLSFGDGGGIGDSYENGQNPDTLNGGVVRIDVDNAAPYTVPPTNPFVSGEGGAPELWALGLRNPWRITVDGNTIYIADVGQQGAEEINAVSISEGGLNFGWPIMEGTECFEADTCDSSGLVPPTLAIARDRSCAVIGGPVYRGSDIVELHGQYIFGDYCFGWMRSAPALDGGLGPVIDWEPMLGKIGNITTFGLDHDGELLVATLDGDVYRITAVR